MENTPNELINSRSDKLTLTKVKERKKTPTIPWITNNLR